MPNSFIMIIELIRLYHYATNQNTIEIKKLEAGFNQLLFYLKIDNNINIYFNFKTELKKFLFIYHKLFSYEDTTITMTKDIETIYKTIIKATKLNIIDFTISDAVHHPFIYHAFNLNLQDDEIYPYLKKNKQIMQLYTKLAAEECQKKDQTSTLEELQTQIEEFIIMLDNLDNYTLTKLKIHFTLKDNECLNELDDYQSYAWHIIMFSNNPTAWEALSYNFLYHCCLEMNEATTTEDEIILNAYQESNNDETETIQTPGEALLKYCIIYLHNFLKSTPDFPNKESLIIKKYLLLSLPELADVAEFLFEHHTLDGLPFPPKEITSSLEEMTDLEVQASMSSLNIINSDKELIASSNLYADTIIHAIFIKAFLLISEKELTSKHIINNLTNNTRYKGKEYQISTDIIDNIIFSNNLHLIR